VKDPRIKLGGIFKKRIMIAAWAARFFRWVKIVLKPTVGDDFLGGQISSHARGAGLAK